MVKLDGEVGIQVGSKGAVNPLRLDQVGALITHETHGKFYEAVKQGNAYFVSLAAGNSTAYTGAAAGTPLIALYNPPGSGVDLSILQSSIGIITEGTGTAGQAFEYWVGIPGTIGTGTKTTPTNMYTQQPSGSKAFAYVNTALTSQTTALTFLRAIVSIGVTPGTTATKDVVNGIDLVDGAIVISPGVLLCIGANGAGTAAKFDASLIWEEIPI